MDAQFTVNDQMLLTSINADVKDRSAAIVSGFAKAAIQGASAAATGGITIDDVVQLAVAGGEPELNEQALANLVRSLNKSNLSQAKIDDLVSNLTPLGPCSKIEEQIKKRDDGPDNIKKQKEIISTNEAKLAKRAQLISAKQSLNKELAVYTAAKLDDLVALASARIAQLETDIGQINEADTQATLTNAKSALKTAQSTYDKAVRALTVRSFMDWTPSLEVVGPEDIAAAAARAGAEAGVQVEARDESGERTPTVRPASFEVTLMPTKMEQEALLRLIPASADKSPRVTLPAVKFELSDLSAGRYAEQLALMNAPLTYCPPVGEKCKGIYYRIPRAAVLKATMGNETVLRTVIDFPQLGHIAKLELINGMFAEDTLNVIFGLGGGISSLEVKSESAGENASAAALEVAEAAKAAADERRTRTSEDLQTQLDALKALQAIEASRIANQGSVLANQTMVLANEAAALTNAETAAGLTTLPAQGAAAQADAQRQLIEAQIQLLETQGRLEALQAGVATEQQAQIQSIQDQTALIEAQIKLERALAELSRERANNAAAE